jgi:hypothetical protein
MLSIDQEEKKEKKIMLVFEHNITKKLQKEVAYQKN